MARTGPYYCHDFARVFSVEILHAELLRAELLHAEMGRGMVSEVYMLPKEFHEFGKDVDVWV